MELDFEAIIQTFIAECEEHFAKMEEALVALETNPEDDRLLEAIFRGAHTLKGNSASLGYPKVAGFAHVYEELLQRFRNRTLPVTRQRITLLLRSLDAMRQMVPEAIAGREVTVGVIGNLVGPVAWRVPGDEQAGRVLSGLRFLPPLATDGRCSGSRVRRSSEQS